MRGASGSGPVRDRATDRLRDCASLANETFELVGIQRLAPIGHRLVGVRMHLDQQTVGARRDCACGKQHRCYTDNCRACTGNFFVDDAVLAGQEVLS